MDGLEFLDSLQAWEGKMDYTRQDAKRILTYLGSPQDKINAVHVAGTNGKGSVSVAIASILSQAASVGLYTSPHLVTQNERIVIDGAQISDSDLRDCADQVRLACEALSANLSYFEAMTIVAFLYFYQLGLDWCVIEVGLGGRLDTTNLIAAPKRVVITSIGLDHQDLLGTNVESIAREKGGIIKRGAIAHLGVVPSSCNEIIKSIANEHSVPLRTVNQDYKVNSINKSYQYRSISDNFSVNFVPALGGEHQVNNMALAIDVSHSLGASSSECRNGIENVFWPGRLEYIEYRDKNFLLDGAHNLDGMRVLSNYLENNRIKQIQLCFGVLKGKDWKPMLDMLLPYVQQINLFRPNVKHAEDLKNIEQYLSGFGISARIWEGEIDSFLEDLNSIRSSNTVDELMLVCGSLYLLGMFRARIKPGPIVYWNKIN